MRRALAVMGAALQLAAAGGQRSLAADLALPARPAGLFFPDLDGDGRPDPVVVYGAEEGCLLGRVVSPLGEAHLEPLGPVGGEPSGSPLLADVDADGTVDLVSMDRGRLVLRRGAGGGAFAAEAGSLAAAGDLLLPPGGCARSPLTLFDVSGDTAPELLAPILGGVRAIPVPPRLGATLLPPPVTCARDWPPLRTGRLRLRARRLRLLRAPVALRWPRPEPATGPS